MHVFNVFDGLLVAVMIFSGFLGFFRGFVKETLSLLAWGGSGVLSWKYHECVCPFLSKWITSPSLLKGACYLTVFLGTLIFFLCIVQWIALKIRSSVVSSVDASLGIVFGLCRGIVLILGSYTCSLFLVAPGQQPEIIQTSKSEKWLNHGAVILSPFLPEKLKNSNFSQSIKLILQNIKEVNILTESLSPSREPPASLEPLSPKNADASVTP
ncbi:colicin V production protein [Holospora undulata HU1]|uniref:Colicin V production protein n=3 Tax=Holosporaceae TaxID=44746 RepID=A0A061JFV0_9PROT|nr:colicin V production protein [Holospora undulata HU1]GAJ46309.1 colicin V production protein [Holospora elegans E1]